MESFLHLFVSGCGALLVVVGGILFVVVGCGLMGIMALKFYRWFIVYMGQEITKAKEVTSGVHD